MLNYQVYHLSNDAEWLVFIHGAGGTISTWKYQIRELQNYFNLLLLDLRDHGGSKNLSLNPDKYNFDLICDDIFEVIDHLNISQAHFVALSLGSAILQRLSQKRLHLPKKLVMAGGIFRATIPMKLLAQTARFMNLVLPYRWMYTLFSWIVMPRKNHQKSRMMYRKEAKKLSPGAFIRWVGLYREFFDVLDQFFQEKMKQLSLVVMGSEDHIFFKAAKRFAHQQESVQLVVLEKCGHICNIEQWQKFNQVTLAFLRA